MSISQLPSRAGAGFLRAMSLVPVSDLSACEMAARGLMMSSHFTFSQVARRWYLTVGIRWQRWQCRVSGLYFRRVTQPVRFWVACGRPAAFRPSLPWWQPFVFGYLSITGWPRRQRC